MSRTLTRRRWRARVGRVLAAALGVAALLLQAPPALADGGGETTQGWALVQQAIGYLVNVPGPEGNDLAMEKINDALATSDQQGVDVSMVKRAKSALDDGQRDEAQSLLQESIAEAVRGMSPATGMESGTGVVAAPIPTGPLTATSWWLLAASLVALAAGLVLAVRYRPVDGVRDLRRRVDSANAQLDPNS